MCQVGGGRRPRTHDILPAMLLFDMMVQVTVGGVFALRDREELAQPASKPADSKAFRDGLLYSMLLYVPSAVFFLAAWPAWNSMYLFDIETRPMWAAWYALLDTVALFLCFIGGFLLAARHLRGGGSARSVVARLIAVWLVIWIVLFVVLWGRSFAVTSYADFVSREWPRFKVEWGAKDTMFGRPLMWWLLTWMVLDFGPLTLIYRRGRARAAKR